MNNFFYILGMEIPQTQTVVTILPENPSIIPDVIPDVKKPLEPPVWIEEYAEEDIEDEYEEFLNYSRFHGF